MLITTPNIEALMESKFRFISGSGTLAKKLSLLRLIHVRLKKVAKIDFFKVGKRLCQSREKNVRG